MSTVLARVHRSRQRQRRGAVLVPVLAEAEVVADLVELGWLPKGASAQQVRVAMLEMLGAALDMRIEPPAGWVLPVTGVEES